jgi:hypothetical protein
MKESSMLKKPVAAAVAAVALLSAAGVVARAESVKNVVLVDGAFADGSGWQRVADILGKDGYTGSLHESALSVRHLEHCANSRRQ